jgi:hypothetical protein
MAFLIALQLKRVDNDDDDGVQRSAFPRTERVRCPEVDESLTRATAREEEDRIRDVDFNDALWSRFGPPMLEEAQPCVVPELIEKWARPNNLHRVMILIDIAFNIIIIIIIIIIIRNVEHDVARFNQHSAVRSRKRCAIVRSHRICEVVEPAWVLRLTPF